MAIPEVYNAAMATIAAEGRKRTVPEGGEWRYDLSSNDYMGLTHDDSIRKFEFGAYDCSSSASRLLASRQNDHRKLESYLADLYGRSVLLFNSGYHANVGAVSALSRPGVTIVADKLAHASIIDGMRLGNGEFTRFRHNDVAHLEKIVAKERAKGQTVIVVTESVFSMDGDVAPLPQLVELKKRYEDVLLYVDEAHAFGAYGPRGLGLSEELDLINGIDIIAGTFGKAAASTGAFIVADGGMTDYLVNTARSFIFSTALPPLNSKITLENVKHLTEMESERVHLHRISERFANGIAELTGRENPSDSQIVPLHVGNPVESVALSERLASNGVRALAIRRPTVPAGTERIRFSLHAALSESDIDEILLIIKNSL